MSRKRAEIKSKKPYRKLKSSHTIVIIVLLIVIVLIASFMILPGSNQSIVVESDGKWLFAMDTDNIQSKYQATGIPTLVIIDKNGEYIFYNSGAQTKQKLDPYIDSALDGTAESYGEVPDFTVTTFDNQRFTLSEYKGKVVILDIMGVGCPPCIIQMPELQKIKKERGEDITILSIDVYYSGESKEDVVDVFGEYIKR